MSDWLPYDSVLTQEIDSAFDLRAPNAAALSTVAQQIEPGDGGEYVLDLATGVGKTYLAAALIEYLARSGIRNVLIVTPGTTILDKTVANFTAGVAKFIPGRTVDPVIITAENFQRGQVGDALHDDTKLKLFIFNVQQLLKPTAKMSRKTRADDEYIGGALYDHLADADDLVIIADEHHVYRSSAKKFNEAVQELHPRALVGLTATPDASDLGKVIYRYTLAEAIRDGLVKIPVVVYRQDGLKDWETQLADAAHLRAEKGPVWLAYASRVGAQPVHPVLFVVCPTIADADKAAEMLGKHFAGEGEVLVITGQSSDEALAELARVEAPDSPVRAIVSVNKLREGWDVRNIGVIVALRALASETLTEQILGRGLRLPFGERTGIASIDQVDIVAHESYQRLLASKDVLLERLTPEGIEPAELWFAPPLPWHPPGGRAPEHISRPGSDVDSEIGIDDLLLTQSYEQTSAQAQADQEAIGKQLVARDEAPVIMFPRRERITQSAAFSLKAVDPDEVRRAGARYSTNLEQPLTRRAIIAQDGVDGSIRVDTVLADGAVATQRMTPAAQVRTDLLARVASLPAVAQTLEERAYAAVLVDAFLEGAGVEPGDEADWAELRARGAAHELGELIVLRQAQFAREPRYTVTLVAVPTPRPLPTEVFDRMPWVGKQYWYGPWEKSVVDYAKFDSKGGEFALAHLLEDSEAELWWMRTYVNGEVWIARTKGKYYPDFIVIDQAGVHWLVEAKSDKDAKDSADVALKASEARDWEQAVRAEGLPVEWRYLLVTESDIKSARNWADLASRWRDEASASLST